MTVTALITKEQLQVLHEAMKERVKNSDSEIEKDLTIKIWGLLQDAQFTGEPVQIKVGG